MAKVSMAMELGVPADKVWELIGGFNALPNWQGKGSVRTLHLAGGGTIEERLEQLDDSERLYRYSIVSGPLPVANYSATLRVRDEGGGKCTVEWGSDFEPAGAPEGDAVEAIRGVYQAGFDNLRKMFGG
jgi:hypothetical protein